MNKRSATIAVMFLLAAIAPMIGRVHSQVPSIPTPREETLVLVTEYAFFQTEMWNPFIPEGLVDYFVWPHILQSPLWWTNYGTGEKVLYHISGWEYADEYKTFTLHIIEGITWNDGTPFTSKDIAFTMNLVKENSGLYYYEWANEWIENLETPDDYTVIFHLTKPNPRMELELMGTGIGNSIVPEHIWKGKDPLTFKNFPPVTTGPYTLYRVIPEVKMLVFERREDLWQPYVLGKEWFPKPKYIVYRVPGAADVEFKNWISGGFDAAEDAAVFFTKELVESGLTYEDTATVGIVDFGQRGLWINGGKYPLSIPEFRWVVSYCVDRDKIAELWPMHPVSWASRYPWADLPGFSEWAYPEIFEKYKFEYDLTKASEILDNLDFVDRDGDGIRETPNGTKLEFFVYAWEPGGYHAYMAEILVDGLRKVGISADFKNVPSSVLFEDEALGKVDMTVRYLATGIDWTGDPYSLIQNYHSKYACPIGEYCEGPWGSYAERLVDPELDEVIDELAVISTDTPEGMELAKKGIELWMRDIPQLPFIECTWDMVFSNAYWTGWPTKTNYYTYPAYWSDNFIEVIFRIVPARTPTVTYSTVWFTEDTKLFLGADLRVYGPFGKGTSASIPESNAATLVDAGFASFAPPTAAEIPIIAEKVGAISDAISGLATSSDVEELASTVEANSAAISGIQTVVYATLGISIIVTILAIAIMLKSRT